MTRRDTEGSDTVRKAPNVVWTALVSVFFATLVCALTTIAIVNEPLFNRMMWEDAWAEWATFFAFLAAGVFGMVGSVRLWRHKSEGLLQRQFVAFQCGLLAVSAFCLLAAGEEISWGQRLLGIQPPEVFQKHNFQQELNFHNILHHLFSPRLVIAVICFGYGTGLPLVVRYRQRQGLDEAGGPLTVIATPLFLMPWFVMTGVVYWVQPIWMSLEAAELLLGLLLLADILTKVSSASSRSHDGSAQSVWMMLVLCLPLALGAAANPVVDRFVFGADEPRAKQAHAELEAIAWDLQNGGAVNPNLPDRGLLYDSRIYNAFRNRWLYFEELGGRFHGARPKGMTASDKKRRLYFLDPWNNAYWIRMRGREPVYLYSFGPNRRLDTVLPEDHGPPLPDQVRGDDIGVWLDIYAQERAAQSGQPVE